MKDYNNKIEKEFYNKIKNNSIANWSKNSSKKNFQMVKFTKNGPKVINSKNFLD